VKAMKITQFFNELGASSVDSAGGKGASLADMCRIGVPVPAGFVVLTDAFDLFIAQTRINTFIEAHLSKVDIYDSQGIEKVSKIIQDRILAAEIPRDIQEEVMASFDRLDTTFVAVRSSSTLEDSHGNSWAGQLESYLNVDRNNLSAKLQECWASLFSPRAIYYRFKRESNTDGISVAVVVQKMVNSQVAGIAFSVHPVTKDRTHIVIEASWGLGSAVVSGAITPDYYIVDKRDCSLVRSQVSRQEQKIVCGINGGIAWNEVPLSDKEVPKLLSEQIRELSKLIIHIEQHYNFPCDIEWAFENGQFYIVQSRPITTLSDDNHSQAVYEKVFTRDFSLPMLQVWYKGEAYDPKPWSGEQQAFLPYIVFVREDDTVKSYYDPKGVEWMKNHLKESANKKKEFLKSLEEQISRKLTPIQSIYEGEKCLSKIELLRFIEDFEAAYPWVEAMWWLCEMSEEELSGLDISSIRNLREATNQLSSGTDIVVRKSLTMLFPHLKEYVHVLTIEEIQAENFPTVEDLKKRDHGFIFTHNKLHVEVTRETVEREYGILLEREVISSESNTITGNIAYPGVARGRVRRIMGHKQISVIEEGEILVSPMTMPDFLPAMERAAAFITDEGGMTCHAAIVAREMQKPCIVGTKVATQVLRDGVLVEVDANAGLVRLLTE